MCQFYIYLSNLNQTEIIIIFILHFVDDNWKSTIMPRGEFLCFFFFLSYWVTLLPVSRLSEFLFFSLRVEMRAVSTWPCWKSSCHFHDGCLEFESSKISLSHLTPHSVSMWAALDRMTPHFPRPPLWWAIVCFPLLSSYINLSQSVFVGCWT